MRLSELKTNEKGVIVKVIGHGGFRKRIIEMGFIKGKTVEVLLNAPLNDPIKYKILGYEISLRRKEAEMIEIISEQEAKEQALQSDSPYNETLKGEYATYFNDENLKRIALGKRRTINVALIGNPNCGKTSLFNLASGAHEHVGNYSGVTVSAKEGYFEFEGYHFRIVDLPGTYSLSAYTPEEMYVRRHIIEQTPDVIINVVDTSNLERNLFLTTQLIDMNVRMVVALNMYDELEASGNTLDHCLLSKLLGVPMVPTVCKKSRGIEDLFHIIINLYEGADYVDEEGNIDPEVAKEIQDWHHEHVNESQHNEHVEDYTYRDKKLHHAVYRHIHINHGVEVEKAIDEIKDEISVNESIRYKYSTRYLAIKLLEKDKEVEQWISELPNAENIIKKRDKVVKRISDILKEDSESAVTNAKYGFISGALKETYIDNCLEQRQATKAIDALVTHRILGFPLFILFMFLMFECTFIFGRYPMKGIEWLFSAFGSWVSHNVSEGPLKDLLIDGIVGGAGGVIVFLPNIMILYFFISIMEDSGYMARAAFIMDKLMHKMGLHGKSFIPLLMGFGCNVPAIMASRTIENHKSRLVTMLVNPLMSCSARLPIYLLLVGAFFPKNESLILLTVYATGILLAVLMARLFNKILVKGDDIPFVMELPPYRMPTTKAIFRHTWEKGVQYLRKMGGIIMLASVIIWFLGYYPNHNAYETVTEQQENSYIGRVGKSIEPVLKPLGFDWKLDIGLLTGIGAKELVVSSLGVLYANDAETNATNLAERMPITPLIAFGYMLFSLIYFPCIASFAAIKHESGSWKWAIFTAVYTTVLAWIVSFSVYQIGSLFL
ncbi:Ferrous iron transport protein B [termite gut metagenome]|uniref:Ferrous iron transport protein B n=1 Tax=termite gut metagenome TaxID=433724 RepID=A0A5J4S1X2_9ZZZZ